MPNGLKPVAIERGRALTRLAAFDTGLEAAPCLLAADLAALGDRVDHPWPDLEQSGAVGNADMFERGCAAARGQSAAIGMVSVVPIGPPQLKDSPIRPRWRGDGPRV